MSVQSSTQRREGAKPQSKRSPVTDAHRTLLGFAHSEIQYVEKQMEGKVNAFQLELLRQARGALELFHASTQ